MVVEFSSTFLFFSFFFFFFLIYLLNLASHRCSKLPPGPMPLPVVGSLLNLSDKPHVSLARLAKAYGPVMALQLGQVINVVVSSPEMSQEVLQKNDLVFANRSVPDVVRALGHHETSVIWLSPCPLWRNLRRIYNTQLFSIKRLDANQDLQLQKVKEMTKYVAECCTLAQAVDIGRAAFTTMLNLITNIVFSIDLIDPNSESSQEFKDLIQHIMEEIGRSNLSDFFPWLAATDLQGGRRRFGAHLAKLHAIFDEQIDHRLQAMAQGTATGDDLLGTLLQCQDEGNESKLERQAIKSFFVDLFAAGSDTTSNTVEWAMAELLRNPKSMAKAQAELAGVIGHENGVEESDIGRLPYLQAIVKETLRLHPPAPFLLPRRAGAKAKLGGYNVPKGARVLVNVWAIGRNPDVWADPERFMPDRFVDREVDFRGRSFELTPFGAGRRICPGLPLASRTVHLMLASLLHGFRWKLPDGMEPQDVDMSERFGVTLAKATPLLALPVPLSSY